MKNGKIYAMLIAAAFLIALIFSFVLLFTVREVEVSYSAYGVADEKAATAILQTFKGKNSLFLSDGEVVSSIKDFPRLKVVSVEKKYPNVLKVNVEERKEVFRLYDGENTLCMDETGFVLQISRGKLPAERDKIALSLSVHEEETSRKVTVYSSAAGENIKTSCDELLYSVIKMARSASLTDVIREIKITDSKEQTLREAEFQTYTGVKIIAADPETRGADKMEKAMDVYDNRTGDYYKTFSEIIVVLDKTTGEISATWERKG